MLLHFFFFFYTFFFRFKKIKKKKINIKTFLKAENCFFFLF